MQSFNTIRSFLMLSIVLGSASCSQKAEVGSSTSAVDYSSASSWLCRPDKKEGCDGNLDATAVNANGSLVREAWQKNPDALIDCFYVYPTVSNDRQPNSDLIPQQDEETRAVYQQFSRFGSQCRLFAPIYRQSTLPALKNQVRAGDHRLAYGDVKNAWHAYLKLAGPGRGVVLIGHSQGADMLKKLVQEEIDGKPEQSRLVSAILLGTRIVVSQGKDVGGDFKSIPACRSPKQTGCVISYASFRKTTPPPASSWFGRNPESGKSLICTNPAELAGGSGVLKPYFFSNHRNVLETTAPPPKPWLLSGQAIQTPYVTLPGLLTAECIQNERDSYLEVTVHGDTADARIDDIGGDIYGKGKVLDHWGLHLIDVHLALGNLLEIVGQQASAYVMR